VPHRVRIPGAAEPREDDAPPVLVEFEIGRRLGGGGMGVVYEARHVLLQRPVALKFLHRALTGSKRARARLLHEAQLLARLRHPNVVTLFGVGAAGQEPFLEMELVENGTLDDWIGEPHAWQEVAEVFLAVGRGLQAVHELGIVHRDVKPTNVLVARDGTPKLGDFGLAVADVDRADTRPWDEALPSSRRRTLTITDGVVGTPAYMAPEQASGAPIDARADQFAFCASLHEVLTGRLPGEPGGERRVPRALRPILARGLAAEPEVRFPTMATLLDALARARRTRPTRSRVTPMPPTRARATT